MKSPEQIGIESAKNIAQAQYVGHPEDPYANGYLACLAEIETVAKKEFCRQVDEAEDAAGGVLAGGMIADHFEITASESANTGLIEALEFVLPLHEQAAESLVDEHGDIHRLAVQRITVAIQNARCEG